MTKQLPEFLQAIRSEQHSFAATLAFINANYSYQPQAFNNGAITNAAGDNQGSCKILGLALLEGLTCEQALLAFGEHYRHVIATPNSTDHANIRQLLQTGLEQVNFSQLPLTRL